MSLSVVAVANLAIGQYLAGILDDATTSKLWSVTPYSSAALGDAEAPTAPSNIGGFPTVEEVEIDAAPDGTHSVGLIFVSWMPNAADEVDTGPCVVQTGPNALAIVASSSSG
jgi:hypothetical protein